MHGFTTLLLGAKFFEDGLKLSEEFVPRQVAAAFGGGDGLQPFVQNLVLNVRNVVVATRTRNQGFALEELTAPLGVVVEQMVQHGHHVCGVQVDRGIEAFPTRSLNETVVLLALRGALLAESSCTTRMYSHSMTYRY